MKRNYTNERANIYVCTRMRVRVCVELVKNTAIKWKIHTIACSLCLFFFSVFNVLNMEYFLLCQRMIYLFMCHFWMFLEAAKNKHTTSIKQNPQARTFAFLVIFIDFGFVCVCVCMPRIWNKCVFMHFFLSSFHGVFLLLFKVYYPFEGFFFCRSFIHFYRHLAVVVTCE